MFAFVAILLCAVDITATHLMGLKPHEYGVVFQVYIVLACVLGALSDGTHRDKSVLYVLSIWAALVLSTDQFNLDLPDILTVYEAFVFSFLVLWVLFRSYSFASDARSDDTVCVCFYKGTRGPLLSTLSSLVGLPFSSIAVVAGDKVLRPSKYGKMVLKDSSTIYASKDFVCVDTGQEITDDFLSRMNDIEGTPTRCSGLLRTRCVSNIASLLGSIGYKPRINIPSLFYFQCVRLSND